MRSNSFAIPNDYAPAALKPLSLAQLSHERADIVVLANLLVAADEPGDLRIVGLGRPDRRGVWYLSSVSPHNPPLRQTVVGAHGGELCRSTVRGLDHGGVHFLNEGRDGPDCAVACLPAEDDLESVIISVNDRLESAFVEDLPARNVVALEPVGQRIDKCVGVFNALTFQNTPQALVPAGHFLHIHVRFP